MSQNVFKETATKILSYIINSENILTYLNFDSYSYLKIIRRFLIEPKLYALISGDNDENSKIKIVDKIQEEAEDLISNNFYIKYDFYIMICEICSKAKIFSYKNELIEDIVMFLINFDINIFSEKDDKFNCHRKIENEEDKKKLYEKFECYLVNLLNYLKGNDGLDEKNLEKILNQPKVKRYKKAYFFLCEENKNYDECLNLKIKEYTIKQDKYTQKERKEFFDWIEYEIGYLYSKEMNEQKISNIQKGIFSEPDIKSLKYYNNFKKALLDRIIILCEISIDDVARLTSIWFNEEGEQEELIEKLGGGDKSSSLQLKYIEHYVQKKRKDINNNNLEKILHFLNMEIDILIKEKNIKRIKQLLIEFKELCNEKTLQKLLQHQIYDCCIYIYQVLGRIKDGIKLTLEEVERKYQNINNILNKNNYNPLRIKKELNDIYKYFEEGLNVCENKFLNQDKESIHIDQIWLELYNKACYLKIDFNPRYEKNLNNNKTLDHKKILKHFQECIQLILDKMNDYINLNLLFEMITENCQKFKLVEFYSFLAKSFYTFRRTESIYNSVKKLFATLIMILYDNLGLDNSKGDIVAYETKCNYCLSSFSRTNPNSMIHFRCGHKYHPNCCLEENDEKVCYICRKEELKKEDKDCDDLMKDKNEPSSINEEEENKEKQEEEERKAKENERKKNNRSKLACLRKLRNKNREINSLLSSNE